MVNTLQGLAQISKMAGELKTVDFSIDGAVDHALRRAGYTDQEIAIYGKEAADAELMRRRVMYYRHQQGTDASTRQMRDQELVGARK